MKSITAKRIAGAPADASAVASTLDAAGIPFEKIDNANWKEYTYMPSAEFRIAHDGRNILIQYRCEEEAVRAEAKADNGAVWEDSCMEFFISFDGRTYYNVECNCAGTLLCANGEGRGGRVHAPLELLKTAKRHSTLAGHWPEEGTAPVKWELSLILPVSLFFRDRIERLDGTDAGCNFYKCGDRLPTPHFLSWNPIDVPTPDFHRPDFFGHIHFE